MTIMNMNMMTAMILAGTALTAIIVMLTAAFAGAGRRGGTSSTMPPIAATAPTRIRRTVMRERASSRSVGLIRPQYLPALVQSRLLRLRMAHLSITTRRQRPAL
jgi:hypothetical protein